MDIKISVIVCTRNEAANIGRCLESLRQQTVPPTEVIVVDNASTDRTVELAERAGVKVIAADRVRDLSEVKNKRGAQLNLGVAASTGEIIFFPDADMTFDPKLLAEIAARFSGEQSLDAAYIPEIIHGRGWFGRMRNFERGFYNQTCIDAVRVVRAEVYRTVGGFDEMNIRFGPDDWDFTKRVRAANYRLGLNTAPLHHHEEWLTLTKYLHKKRSAYGDTFDEYIAKWSKNDPDIRRQFGLSYRYFGVFTERGKWRRLASHPGLASAMYLVRAAVGWSYLINTIKKIWRPAR